MQYVCDLFFIFILSLFVINHITSSKQKYLFFLLFLEYLLLFLDDNVDNENEQLSNSKSSALACCLAFT